MKNLKYPLCSIFDSQHISLRLISTFHHISLSALRNGILTDIPQEIAAYAAQQHGTASTAEDIARMLIEQKTRANTADLL